MSVTHGALDPADRNKSSPPKYTLPTLPSPLSLVIGAGLCLLLWPVFYYVVLAIWWIFLGKAMSIPAYGALVTDLAYYGGLALVVLLWYRGGAGHTIEIGYKGVPLLFGQRFGFFMPQEWRPLFSEGLNFNIPNFFGYEEVNMQVQPLVHGKGQNADEIEVEALALVQAPETPRMSGEPVRDMSKVAFVKARVRIAVRVQIFDPHLWLSTDDAFEILVSAIKEIVRLWVQTQQLNELPALRANLTNELEKKLDKVGAEMGVDFVKLFVTEILPPQKVLDEAEKIPIEMLQRNHELTQADTVAQIAQKIRASFPNLSDEELKDMVLVTMQHATMRVISIRGQQGAFNIFGADDGKHH